MPNRLLNCEIDFITSMAVAVVANVVMYVSSNVLQLQDLFTWGMSALITVSTVIYAFVRVHDSYMRKKIEREKMREEIRNKRQK